jgi:thioredoxin-dependent peroxiredoxin
MQRLIHSALFLLTTTLIAATPPQPDVGTKAADFTLKTVDGKAVKLADLTSQGSVVLVVLRGYPGYQCPFCNRQAQDFIQKAADFSKAGAQVVLVYPGPPQDTNAKAAEFLSNKQMPANFTLLLDPGYEFTNAWGLRWDAANETAYPSTFLIDTSGTIYFSKVVKSHGGRTSASEIVSMLPKPR